MGSNWGFVAKGALVLMTMNVALQVMNGPDEKDEKKMQASTAGMPVSAQAPSPDLNAIDFILDTFPELGVLTFGDAYDQGDGEILFTCYSADPERQDAPLTVYCRGVNRNGTENIEFDEIETFGISAMDIMGSGFAESLTATRLADDKWEIVKRFQDERDRIYNEIQPLTRIVDEKDMVQQVRDLMPLMHRPEPEPSIDPPPTKHPSREGLNLL